MNALFPEPLILPSTGELIIVTPMDVGSGSVAAIVITVAGQALRLKSTVEMHPGALDVSVWSLCEVEAYFATDSKTYRLSGKTRNARVDGDDLHFEMDVRAVERIQRRNDFRILLNSATRLLVGRDSACSARIMDLSAGGVLLMCNHELATGERVEVEIPTDEDGGLMLRAEVLESAEERNGYRARCTFDNGDDVRTSEEVRDQIARYVFRQERAMLKVRKLIGAPQADSAGQSRQRSQGLSLLVGR